MPGGPPDDLVGDWHTVLRSESPVSVGGVAAVEQDVIVAIAVRGGNPLTIVDGGQAVVTVSPSIAVSHYIVVARLDRDGSPEWARVVLQNPGEASGDELLAIRGGPFVHAGGAVTLGYMTTEVVLDDLKTSIGILRLGAEGAEVWRRTLKMTYPEPADFSFAHVCASPGGRVAASFPAIQDDLGSFEVLASRDEQLVEDLTAFSSAGLSSGVVTWSSSGELEQVGWVRSDAAEAFSLGCSVRDDGSVVAMGFARGDTLIAEATSAPNEVRQTQVLGNEQFAWAAAFSADGLPTSVAIVHSTPPSAENGLSAGFALDEGAILAGLFQGAVSVVSSSDGTLRTLQGQDPGGSSNVPMAAVLVLDKGLRLKAGARIEAGELSWVQTLVVSPEVVTVAGGGRGLPFGPVPSPDGRGNYFISVLDAGTFETRWSLGLADLESPLTGDFVLGPLVVESVSATILDHSVVVGMTANRPLSLAPHGEGIAVGSASAGIVAKRNSAGGLECLAR
jgi:hypothetical protein